MYESVDRCHLYVSNPEGSKPQSIALYAHQMVNMTEYCELQPYYIVDGCLQDSIP